MRILVVEDDERLGLTLTRGFGEEGHEVDLVARGVGALAQLRDVSYDVVVLDWGLPDLDGVSVLRAMRERGDRTPVIMLTARGTVGERVTGLRAGADDFLVKPFAFEELLARLDALARRSVGQLDALVAGSVSVDGRRRTLRAGEGGVEVPLTPREFGLAAELFRHRGEVLSRSHLLRAVWGTDFLGDPNVVDVYVGYLRAKLTRTGARDVAIRAVRGVGFRLVDGGASEDGA